MSDYFTPNTASAALILGFIGALAISFVTMLFITWKRLGVYKVMRTRARDLVIQLANMREPSIEVGEQDASTNLETLAAQHDLPPDKVLTKAILAMYSASKRGRTIDVPSIRHELDQELRGQLAWIRHILPIFLIAGLLGTLLGLTDTIQAVMQLFRAESDASNALVQLLWQLRGAFAPSIWGVIATVTFSLVTTLFLHIVADPTILACRSFLVFELVPALSRTPAEEHRAINAELCQSAVQLAQTVARVREELSTYGGEVTDAKAVAAAFSTGMLTFNTALSESRDELTETFKSLTRHAKAFDKSVANLGSFDGHLRRLADCISELQRSETEVLGRLEQITNAHAEVSQKATVAFTEAATAHSADLLRSVTEIQGIANGLSGPMEAAGKSITQAADLLPSIYSKALQEYSASFGDRVDEALERGISKLANAAVEIRDAARQLSSPVNDWADAIRKQACEALQLFDRSISSVTEQLRSEVSTLSRTMTDTARSQREFQEYLTSLVRDKTEAFGNAIGTLKVPFQDAASMIQRQLLAFQTNAEQELAISRDAAVKMRTLSEDMLKRAQHQNGDGSPAKVVVDNVSDLVLAMEEERRPWWRIFGRNERS